MHKRVAVWSAYCEGMAGERWFWPKALVVAPHRDRRALPILLVLLICAEPVVVPAMTVCDQSLESPVHVAWAALFMALAGPGGRGGQAAAWGLAWGERKRCTDGTR